MPPTPNTEKQKVEKQKILTNREKQLIRFLRQLEWGEVRVRVENGQPVLIYEAIRTMRLVEGDIDNKKTSKKTGLNTD